MPDIWHQVATALNADVDSALWRLRESPIFKEMGSEIERAFAAHFSLSMLLGGMEFELAKVPKAECGFFLIPQYVIEGYRVDFVLGHSKMNFEMRKAVVIECDGHDWHEKTKAQAAKDKKRDRALQQNFGAVLHFTGSEIYRDPAACLTESVKALSAVYGRYSQ